MRNRRVNRRDLLRSAGRAVAALAVVALTAGLAMKRGSVDKAAQACINRGLCCGCSALANCVLPAGMSTRAGAVDLRQRSDS